MFCIVAQYPHSASSEESAELRGISISTSSRFNNSLSVASRLEHLDLELLLILAAWSNKRFVVDIEGDEKRTQTENVGKNPPKCSAVKIYLGTFMQILGTSWNTLVLKTVHRFHMFNLLSFKLHHVHLQFAMPTTSASSGVGNVEPKY